MASFSVPSLADVLERTRQAFKAQIPSSDPWVFPSNIYVASKVIAGRIWEALHRIEYIGRQWSPLTATGSYLDRHAQSFGLSRNPATKATGTASGTGGTSGVVIPAGTVLQRLDGLSYVVKEDATVTSAGVLTVTVEASDFGSGYNFEAGGAMAFSTTLAGTPDEMFVSSSDPLIGGGSEESDDELRARVLLRLQYPPHAGTVKDYERWAKEVPGVTRVFVQAKAFGPGTVGIWPLMDDKYSNGIPQASDIATIQAYIDDLAPATATVTVAAPIAEPITIKITGLSPYTPAVIKAVRAELKAMIRAKAGVSTQSKPSYIRRSWIWQAAANTSGEEYHTVESPTADYPATPGRILVYDDSFVTITGE